MSVDFAIISAPAVSVLETAESYTPVDDLSADLRGSPLSFCVSAGLVQLVRFPPDHPYRRPPAGVVEEPAPRKTQKPACDLRPGDVIDVGNGRPGCPIVGVWTRGGWVEVYVPGGSFKAFRPDAEVAVFDGPIPVRRSWDQVVLTDQGHAALEWWRMSGKPAGLVGARGGRGKGCRHRVRAKAMRCAAKETTADDPGGPGDELSKLAPHPTTTEAFGAKAVGQLTEVIRSAVAGGAPSAGAVKPQEPMAPRLTVDLPSKMLTFDGRAYPVRSERALRWVKVLADRAPAWVSSKELSRLDQDLLADRTDKFKKSLPAEVLKLIDSQTGAGSRIRL
jgi:hypothetical protein